MMRRTFLCNETRMGPRTYHAQRQRGRVGDEHHRSFSKIPNADLNSEGQRMEHRKAERRRDLRYPFTAAVEVFEPQSQSKLTARTSDISLGGCYVDTINPLPVSTDSRSTGLPASLDICGTWDHWLTARTCRTLNPVQIQSVEHRDNPRKDQHGIALSAVRFLWRCAIIPAHRSSVHWWETHPLKSCGD